MSKRIVLCADGTWETPNGVEGAEAFLRELKIGETAEVVVVAKESWNHSALLLKKGKRYGPDVPEKKT